LDLKGALVWRFWNRLFEAAESAGETERWAEKKPAFGVYPELETAAHSILVYFHRHWGVAQSNSY
jgi:hypothetical protein